jgi:hypothetical protein
MDTDNDSFLIHDIALDESGVLLSITRAHKAANLELSELARKVGNGHESNTALDRVTPVLSTLLYERIYSLFRQLHFQRLNNISLHSEACINPSVFLNWKVSPD